MTKVETSQTGFNMLSRTVVRLLLIRIFCRRLPPVTSCYNRNGFLQDHLQVIPFIIRSSFYNDSNSPICAPCGGFYFSAKVNRPFQSCQCRLSSRVIRKIFLSAVERIFRISLAVLPLPHSLEQENKSLRSQTDRTKGNKNN